MKSLSIAAITLWCTVSSCMALSYNAPTLIFNSSADQGHHMPPKTVFTDRSPSINDNGEMAITLTLVGGSYDSAIWVKSHLHEGVLIRSGAKESFSDVKINNQSNLCFTHQTLNGIKGVYTASDDNHGSYLLTDHMSDDEFYAYSSFSNLTYNEKEELLFTAKNFRGDVGIFNYTPAQNGQSMMELIELQNQRSSTPKSFLFAPSFNDRSQVAYKARFGNRGELNEERPDKILLFTGKQREVLVEDRDSKPTSRWISFRNSISLNNRGAIAFIGQDDDGEKLVLRESEGREIILATAKKEIKDFSFFSLKLNDKNQVAFRARDRENRHAIFVADKKGMTRVLTQFDEITTPWGKSLIAYGPHIPFGGNIDMNNHGDIIVNTGLANLDNSDDHGNGVVVIYAKR